MAFEECQHQGESMIYRDTTKEIKEKLFMLTLGNWCQNIDPISVFYKVYPCVNTNIYYI